jgi:hypothetical protein
VRERSHKLSDAQREWIVRRLAARDSPTAIRSGVRERFGIEISRQTIESYDPTRNPQCGRRWTALYRDVRKDHGASHAGLTASARQVERLARRIVEILERRILAGPGSAARGCVKKPGAITDQDRLRALAVFVARLRVTDPAGLAAIRRALFDNGGPQRAVPHAG